LSSLQRLVPRNLENRLSQINGEPGIVSYLDGRPFSVLTLEVSERHIQTIYILTNPEKLARLPELPANET